MHIVEVKTILTPQNGMNIYRGVTDHCIVSPVRAKTARVENPEDVEVKQDAARVLEHSLRRKRTRGMISVGGLSDPYNPLEEKFGIMRDCLRVLDRCDFGVCITTRYSLLLRDLDILKELARKTKVVICIPFPTVQTEQFRLIEGELGMSDRLRLIDELSKEKIETVLLLDPIIPKINDTKTSLGMLLQLAGDYHIRMVDHRDMKCQLQNGSREYFYKELLMRDRDLALKLREIYGEENELVPENQKDLLAYLFDSCKANDVICDRKEILTYCRKYENKTEGEQLSIDSFIG
ncbi:MAG: hypothetical protein K5897_05990 [Eubacterium sp.]|jgi:DNA repair photolyase|nr:hypothetical protein [Eubacterium sp.]